MSQKEELIAMMQQLQNYLRSHDVYVTTEEIYDSFREYGLSENEKGQPITDVAKKEIYAMLEKKTGERKCSFGYEPLNDGWNFFHTNNNSGGTPNYEWKVYVPIKMEHYGFVVKNIIAFLSDNGIVSECKVSGSMRSDSLVVNLENEDDVTRVNQYLDSNPSLKSCLGSHQPFIPDFNGIGVVHGYDEKTSYTERLSGYLAHYVDVCKEQKRLDLIIADGFLESMRNALNSGMVQKLEEIQQIIEHMDIILNGKNYIQQDSQKEGKSFGH